MNAPALPPAPPPTSGFSRRAALGALAALAATPVLAGRATAAPGSTASTGTTATTRTTGTSAAAADPDLGPNVLIFDPAMPIADIQAKVSSVFSTQESNQFGTERFALLFKPGTYDGLDVNVGFYTHVAGLGLSPDDVDIHGLVHVEADWMQGNATQNFWRSAENLSVTPTGGSNRWAVSQAAPLRRVHIRGEVPLWNGYDGWSSGGFMADCKVDGRVVSGSQQQWLTRSSTLGSWDGSVWNMVFVGVDGAPPQNFPNPSHTVVDRAPVVREKPFLYVDGSGAYQVFVPALRTAASGVTWSGGAQGESIPLSDFHVAKPGDSTATINAALAQGKHLLVTPGVYQLDATVEVTRAGTVVLGLGIATLVPGGGITALSVADVDGVKISGLLIDAGAANSAVLVRVGPQGASAGHAADPTLLQDVFVRIGGAQAGRATVSVEINSSDVIGDNLWLWRADHGSGVGWDVNTSDTGLVVNGANVTMYGLFVEHHQKAEVVWNGNGGRTYFFQNEMPYDPPNQAAWTDGSRNGYPAYRVADAVTSHEAWGVGSYCLFLNDPTVVAENAFQVPDRAGVAFHDLVTVSLGGDGTISHVINTAGDPVNSANTGISYLVSYP
ncbi:adenylyl cyclase [Streptomyces sp. NBC_01477]|uniref:adenylyl cyclase n=1 Tax=Streptomyces sp. NBC_01477 TaxID=2976015 RepID=UPI002E345F54|nr:adenylyl cyclase [Streptomyces sp. NBC_01477]